MVAYMLHGILTALTLSAAVQAVVFPVTALPKRSAHDERRRSAQTGEVALGDENDISYVTQVSAGGKTYSVLLDTGSSDLTLLGTVAGTTDENIPIELDFAIGELDGVMSFVDIEFGGYTVQSQIFNHAQSQQGTGNDGLLGLGPSYASVLWDTAQRYIKAGQLPHNAGDSLLDRIFQSDTTTGNCIAVYMSRNDDPSSSTLGQGVFTIAEVLSEYNQVMNMPVLPVVMGSEKLLQHFAVALDGFIGNNGQAISLPTSAVPGIPAGKMVAAFDTGYTFPQVPEVITDAIYADVPGAKKQTLGDGGVYWTMPCGQVVNAAFIFAGKTYPIHPLDLNFDGHFLFSDLPAGTCMGAFQPMTDAAVQALDGQADMFLGMAFLRNVYSLFNYGDWIDSTMDSQYEPFVQLLSITDPNAAAQEFQSVRGGGSSAGGHLSKGAVSLATTPASSQTTPSTVLDWIKSHLQIVIPVAVAVVLIATGIVIWGCICCRRRRQSKAAYQNLSAPAPGHAPTPQPQHYRYGSSPFKEKGMDIGYSYAASPPAPLYDDPYMHRGLLEKQSA